MQAITAKLAIIAGLFVGLAAYLCQQASAGALSVNAPTLSGWPAFALAFGLLVTVQGFETSRYLGDEYDSQTRIRSMRWAQWAAAIVYIIYILLITYSFQRTGDEITETTIIDMMRVVAPILPALLVAAALAAQFSAAVADTGGCGGLISELTGGRVSPRMAYALLTGIGLTFTWTSNVFEIITHASRVFAVYYGLQAAIASVRSHAQSGANWRTLGFGVLALLGIVIAIFGRPVE